MSSPLHRFRHGHGAGPSPGFRNRRVKHQKGGGTFLNTILDVCSNRGAKREMGGTTGGGPGTVMVALWDYQIILFAESDIEFSGDFLNSNLSPVTRIQNTAYWLFLPIHGQNGHQDIISNSPWCWRIISCSERSTVFYWCVRRWVGSTYIRRGAGQQFDTSYVLVLHFRLYFNHGIL